jgi:NAD+ kinase
VIRQDPNSPKAAALVEALMASGALENLPDEVCVVVGGDGHMLRVIDELGEAPLYLGLNAGTLGFMLNDVEDLEATTRRMQSQAWNVLELPQLQLTASTVGGMQITATAVNDIYLERISANTAHLRVQVNGVQVVERMTCDGLIVATAMGSTAYSFSAGGPACHPNLRLVQLTSICPHLPKLPPITLPPDSIVEVEVLATEKRPTRVVTDGREHPAVHKVRVEDVRRDVRLAYLEGHHPTGTLIRKLLK